ncbi:DUF134 domain-containing protein [Falsiporphyromonas endometrii]|uniref:UPF0251 protein ACFO3G_06050 n=1 Tax=Falsiporphyromonas endometrii TaxID=1387297 RepID=A0ABV9K7Y7_9PORP
MARPKQCRYVSSPPIVDGFRPVGCFRRGLRETLLTYDEFETLRLADYLGMQQDEAAEQMNVSRPTFTRIYDAARKKVAHALVEGRTLNIDGGHVTFKSVKIKNDTMKKIAIPTEQGKLFGHFGRATHVTIISLENNKIVSTQSLETPKHEHGSLPKFLKENGVSDVIVNSIGQGAVNFLVKYGIEIHQGAPLEPVMDIVQQFLDGTIVYGEGQCNHHEHHHEHGKEEGHECCGKCGEHK